MFPNGTRLSRCHTGRTDYDTPKGRGMNQDAFTRALLRPDLPTPSDIIAPAHDSATRRFAVYRNNVIASLSDALETTFPAIRALLGDTNFRNSAGVYCRAHPSTLPIMQQFGAVPALYFWVSALTKLGDGFFGFLFPSAGAYVQIFPHAMENVGYDPSDLGRQNKNFSFANLLYSCI